MCVLWIKNNLSDIIWLPMLWYHSDSFYNVVACTLMCSVWGGGCRPSLASVVKQQASVTVQQVLQHSVRGGKRGGGNEMTGRWTGWSCLGTCFKVMPNSFEHSYSIMCARIQGNDCHQVWDCCNVQKVSAWLDCRIEWNRETSLAEFQAMSMSLNSYISNQSWVLISHKQ